LTGGRGGDDAENSEKDTQAKRAAKAARRPLRRDAERQAMRDVADARRARQAHALPAASISAQLRHLRKPQYGAFLVEKRPRAVRTILRGEDFGTIWEYRLKRAIRRKRVGGRSRRAARRLSVQTSVSRISKVRASEES